MGASLAVAVVIVTEPLSAHNEDRASPRKPKVSTAEDTTCHRPSRQRSYYVLERVPEVSSVVLRHTVCPKIGEPNGR